MATIYDIAKKAGVSSATVSRVLNGVKHPVSEKTKRIIMETASELDYRPNTIAKSLTKGRTNTIAILLPSITNDFYTQFVIL
jgi:LacI family transcriptional regulator